MKLEPHGVGGKRSARQSRPLDPRLAFLDPFRARPSFVVQSNDALSRAGHVRYDEAAAGIKFSGMPLDLGDHSSRLRPACRLVGEIGVVPPDFVRRPSDRALAQIVEPGREDLIWGQARW